MSIFELHYSVLQVKVRSKNFFFRKRNFSRHLKCQSSIYFVPLNREQKRKYKHLLNFDFEQCRVLKTFTYMKTLSQGLWNHDLDEIGTGLLIFS